MGLGFTTPGSPEWDARNDAAGRLMRLIADGAVDRDGVAGLAARVGLTEEDVDRVLVAETGAGALVLAAARRGMIARVLRDHRGGARGDGIAVRLPFRPPLDGAGLVAFLAARVVPGVEEVVDGTYRRSLRLPYGAGVAELTPREDGVEAVLRLDDLRDVGPAAERCTRVLDLDCDPVAIVARLGPEPALGPLVRAAPGLRVPGHVDGVELAVRALLGQQISLAAAGTLAARLVAAHGEPLRRPVGGITHVFPTAEALADADIAAPESRRRALAALAGALASGDVRLDAGADRAEAEASLLALPGIGPWTASYIAMRALRDPDAFLPSDLGVRHGLERLGQDPRPGAAVALAERWRPYRAYAVVHLWRAAASICAAETPPRPLRRSA